MCGRIGNGNLTLALPAVVGVPDIAPLVLMVKFAGRPVAVNEYAPDPPVACTCTGP